MSPFRVDEKSLGDPTGVVATGGNLHASPVFALQPYIQ